MIGDGKEGVKSQKAVAGRRLKQASNEAMTAE
jgi:hypothetical protein